MQETDKLFPRVRAELHFHNRILYEHRLPLYPLLLLVGRGAVGYIYLYTDVKSGRTAGVSHRGDGQHVPEQTAVFPIRSN